MPQPIYCELCHGQYKPNNKVNNRWCPECRHEGQRIEQRKYMIKRRLADKCKKLGVVEVKQQESTQHPLTFDLANFTC